jgi:hypothetical protein
MDARRDSRRAFYVKSFEKAKNGAIIGKTTEDVKNDGLFGILQAAGAALPGCDG